MNTVKSPEASGWWVPAAHWFEQRLWPHTGCWQQVKCADGTVKKACVLYGYNGWWDTNYRQVSQVVGWLKPTEWFQGPEDMVGKEAEWHAYRNAAFENKSPLRAVA